MDLASQGAGGYDLCLNGATDSDRFVAAATGDLNGDGVADLVITGGDTSAYVIFGGSGLPASGTIQMGQPGAGGAAVTLLGAGNFTEMACGDVNGDGVEDLLVGARYNDYPGGGREWAGAVYVVFGRKAPAAFPASLNLSVQGNAGANLTLYGASAGDQLTVRAIADLTGDGISDLVLRAGLGDGPGDGRTNAGETFLVWGRPAAEVFPAVLDMAVQGAGGANVTLYDEGGVGEYSGFSVVVDTADINGDGIADLILHNIYQSDAGGAHVVFGRAADLVAGTLDLSIQGAGGCDVKIKSAAGSSLSGMTSGDLNSDGIADLVFGTRGNAAHIVLGRRLPTAFPALLDLAKLGADGSSVLVWGRPGQEGGGDDALSLWGMVCGDFNGDQITDLLLSAVGMNGPVGDRPAAGGALLMSGAAGPPVYLPKFKLLREAGGAEPVLAGSIVDFGAATEIDGGQLSFQILNAGSAVMTLLGEPVIEINGAHAGDFSIGEFYPASLNPGEAVSFSIFFAPKGAGIRSATVSIASNDADAASFVFALQGTGNVPMVGTFYQASEIPAEGLLGFESVAVIAGERERLLRISNTGSAPLKSLRVEITGAAASEFDMDAIPDTDLAPGAWVEVPLRFNPSAPGSRQAKLEIRSSNAPNALDSPFVINLAGTGLAPLLEVVHLGVTRAPDEVLNFGSVEIQGGSRFLHLQLQNRGDAPMTGLSAGLLENNGAEFEIVALSSDVIQAGAMALLSVRFSPSEVGPRPQAWLEIGSNESNAGIVEPYVLGLGGTGMALTSAPKPVMENPGAQVNRVGEAVALRLFASFFPTKFVVKGLPPGLRYDAASQFILGYPTTPKLDKNRQPLAYPVKISAANALGTGAEITVDWTILPLPADFGGSFSGLVAPQAQVNGGLGGSISFTVAAAGSVSGKVWAGGKLQSFKGALTVAEGGGSAVLDASIPSKNPAEAVTLELTLEDGQIIEGSRILSNGGEAAVSGWRNESAPPLSMQGIFNVALESQETGEGIPEGDGWAIVKISSKGVAAWSGRLADGTSLIASHGLSAAGATPLFAMLYKGGGAVRGWSNLNPESGDLDDDDGIIWLKNPEPASSKGRVYKNGIPEHLLTLQGGRYRLNEAGLILDFATPGPGMVNFNGGGLLEDLWQDFDLKAKNAIGLPKGAPVKVAVNAKTGMITTSFNEVRGGKKLAVKGTGLLVPRLSQGPGHILVPQGPASTDAIHSGRLVLERE
jgi:hypothetical protein